MDCTGLLTDWLGVGIAAVALIFSAYSIYLSQRTSITIFLMNQDEVAGVAKIEITNKSPYPVRITKIGLQNALGVSEKRFVEDVADLTIPILESVVYPSKHLGIGISRSGGATTRSGGVNNYWFVETSEGKKVTEAPVYSPAYWLAFLSPLFKH